MLHYDPAQVVAYAIEKVVRIETNIRVGGAKDSSNVPSLTTSNRASIELPQ